MCALLCVIRTTDHLYNRPTCITWLASTLFSHRSFNITKWLWKKKVIAIAYPDQILFLIPDCGPLVWPAGVGLVPRHDGDRERHADKQEGFLEQTDSRECRNCGDLHSPPYAALLSHSNIMIQGIRTLNRTTGPPLLTDPKTFFLSC